VLAQLLLLSELRAAKSVLLSSDLQKIKQFDGGFCSGIYVFISSSNAILIII